MLIRIMLLILVCFSVSCSSSDSTGRKQGDLDPTFNSPDGYVTYVGWNKDSYLDTAIQADGKIVVSTGILNSPDSNVGVLRYNSDGTLDQDFGTGGVIIYDGGKGKDSGRSVAIDMDEKIILTGYTYNGNDYDLMLMRLNTDGTRDQSFGTEGIVLYDNANRNNYGRGIALQPDQKIVVTAKSTEDSTSLAMVLRYLSDGTLDPSFGVNGVSVYEGGEGNDGFRDLAIQSDEKIVVAGYTRTTEGFEILTGRFNMDGNLDSSFGTDGIARYNGGYGNAGARGVTILSDGRIIVSGSNDNGTDLDLVLLAYRSDGSLDNGFGTDGVVAYDGGKGDDNGRRLALQQNDRIVVTGNTSNGNDYDTLILSYHSNGTIDTAFGRGGVSIIRLGHGNDWGEAVAIQSDQNIVVAGGVDNEQDEIFTMRVIGSLVL